MLKELFVSTRGKTHAVALVEGGKLVEFNSESDDDASIVGNIYKGKVEQVLKGMQAAFVNIGRKKNGYLFVGDSMIDNQDISSYQAVLEQSHLEANVGDEIMVQVSKTEIGAKGARLTPNISIAGRYLVYMPNVNYIGVSRKIVDEAERDRLTQLVESVKGETGGFIIRTACKDAKAEDIISDAKLLVARFEKIKKAYLETPCSHVVYKEGGILFRAIRDLIGIEASRIVVDDHETFVKIQDYLIELGMDTSILSIFKEKNVDLFNFHGLTAQILHVLDSKVELENGAYLVIEKTEALTVIDVNTGKYVGNQNLEDTVFETNMLAAKAIAAQLRLRNVGGIIIVDFIDMTSDEHNKMVMDELTEYCKKDRIRTAVVDMTELGLVEITRKKSRNEVKQKLSVPCKACGGKGYVMTNEALASLVRKKLFEIFANDKITAVQINMSHENAQEFFVNRALSFEITVFWHDKRIYVVGDNHKGQDSFDIVAFESDVIEIPSDAALLY